MSTYNKLSIIKIYNQGKILDMNEHSLTPHIHDGHTY